MQRIGLQGACGKLKSAPDFLLAREHRVACHLFESLPKPAIAAQAGPANGKFAERLAAFEAAKVRVAKGKSARERA